jgi:hypothetical protein
MPKRKPIDYTPQFGSGIFRPKDEVESELTAIETATSIPLPAEKEKEEETLTSTNISNKAIKKESKLASNQDSLQASNHASTLALSKETLESIRKIVKNPGKEDVLYVRLTKGEKDKLADVIYTYKRQGVRTSDTEVVRVAINTLLEDYKSNGEKSLLAIILASLHA